MINDIRNIHIGKTVACRCVFIDGHDCEFNAEIKISEQLMTNVILHDVGREIYNSVKDKDTVVLCMKKDERYITVITNYMTQNSFRHCLGNDVKETGITLSYASSRVLYGFDCRDTDIIFDEFTFEVTEGLELIGEYPFEHNINDDVRNTVVTSKGRLIHRDLSDGFSYFVAPDIKKTKEGLLLNYQYKFQYKGEKKVDIDFIDDCLRQIIVFLEVLSGETVSINQLSLISDSDCVEYIGINNFIKKKLNCFSNGVDTASFLRKSVFKISDFNNYGEGLIGSFRKINADNYLAFESYKQVLLDEEVKIITYNKFLKVMQIVEGYQRADEEENSIEEFNIKKQSIIEKLVDEDKTFIEKYTKYNGETFRKCLGKFTYDSVKIISGISKTNAKDIIDELLSKIINDRDVYTHASKKIKPQLSYDELEYVIVCYKVFFRVLILHKLGLSDELIRTRLYHNRTFASYYQHFFGIKLPVDERNMSTGAFDAMMWGYDKVTT